MFTKLFAGSFLLLGLLFAGLSGGEPPATDCCAKQMACCEAGAACCQESKPACCAAGDACCEEVAACCTTGATHGAAGAERCEMAQ